MNNPLSDDNLKNDNQKQDDDILWHYTNIDALFDIVTEKRLRATHIKFLNDSMEVHSGFDTIITALKESSPEDAKLTPREIDDFREMINQTVSSPTGYYIVSFSDKKDCLTQWQTYAPREGGCAIGFKKSIADNSIFELNDKEKKKYDSNSNKNLGWWSLIPRLSCCHCEYNTPENKEWLCNRAIELIKTIINEKEDTVKLKEGVIQLFTSCLAGVKDASFQQESEWRLVLKHYGEKIQFDENQRPYFHLKFKDDIDFHNIISEIMISPRGNRSLTRKKLNFLIDIIDTLGEKDTFEEKDSMEEKNNRIIISDSKLPLQ